MTYVLRPAQPTDEAPLRGLGVALHQPRGRTEADFFSYPSSEIWIAEQGGSLLASTRLCHSGLSRRALLTDLAGSPEALRPLAAQLLHIARSRGAETVEAAVGSTSPLIAPLAELGLQGYRRVVHIVWRLPAPSPGAPPEGVHCTEEVPDPDEYARLAVAAYRGAWDWLFEHWGGDAAARRMFARLLESPRTERFIAARTLGSLAGFASYGSGEGVAGDFSTFGVLVRPDQRGQGIGRHLLLSCLAALARAGRTTAHMHTTAYPDADPPAVRLYLHGGGERAEDFLILRAGA